MTVGTVVGMTAGMMEGTTVGTTMEVMTGTKKEMMVGTTSAATDMITIMDLHCLHTCLECQSQHHSSDLRDPRLFQAQQPSIAQQLRIARQFHTIRQPCIAHQVPP
jgi:hypothetical protein